MKLLQRLEQMTKHDAFTDLISNGVGSLGDSLGLDDDTTEALQNAAVEAAPGAGSIIQQTLSQSANSQTPKTSSIGSIGSAALAKAKSNPTLVVLAVAAIIAIVIMVRK